MLLLASAVHGSLSSRPSVSLPRSRGHVIKTARRMLSPEIALVLSQDCMPASRVPISLVFLHPSCAGFVLCAGQVRRSSMASLRPPTDHMSKLALRMGPPQSYQCGQAHSPPHPFWCLCRSASMERTGFSPSDSQGTLFFNHPSYPTPYPISPGLTEAASVSSTSLTQPITTYQFHIY